MPSIRLKLHYGDPKALRYLRCHAAAVLTRRPRLSELPAAQRKPELGMEEVRMAETLTVPPNLVGRVREGTYGLLAAEAIVRSAHAHEQPEPMSHTNLEHASALPGRLGWTGDQDSGEAIERAPEHSTALHAAIETMVPLLAGWLDDLDLADARRPDRAEELRLVRQFAVGLEGDRGGLQ